MSFDEAVRPRPPVRFEGEDTSATTPRELNGWYSYAIAAEVFAVVGVGSFLPVTLEQLARERGVFFSERSRPCTESGSAGGPAKFRIRDDGGQDDQCIVHFLGSDVTTASFAMYTFSAAVLAQAVTLVCFSSFADHGPYRKKMLMTFAYLGSLVSALFIFVSPTVYWIAPILVIIGVTCLGCSFTLLNAFLPLLVTNYSDPSKLSDSSSFDHELEALNPESTSTWRSNPEKLASDLERSAKISSKGVGLGYMAAVFVQCISILILFLFSKTPLSKSHPTLPMRVILLVVGLWWSIFTLPTLLWLRPRPGSPLPTSKPRSSSFLYYLKFSLSSFYTTIKRALHLRQTLIFLASWFLLSDAIATISGTAVLFARTELLLSTIAIALLSITSISFGIIGAFAWPLLSSHFRILSNPKSVLLACIALMELIPLYGLLAYLPPIRSLGVGGLQKPWEIYPLGALHGFIMGGISSYARAVYTPLIPKGHEAAFFALYAVTDKGSSALGPALVGWIVDRAGTIRPAFGFLAVLCLVPGPLVWWVDIERGRKDAEGVGGAKGMGMGMGRGHGRVDSGVVDGEMSERERFAVGED